jgi:hypothetical protein
VPRAAPGADGGEFARSQPADLSSAAAGCDGDTGAGDIPAAVAAAEGEGEGEAPVLPGADDTDALEELAAVAAGVGTRTSAPYGCNCSCNNL